MNPQPRAQLFTCPSARSYDQIAKVYKPDRFDGHLEQTPSLAAPYLNQPITAQN